MHPVALLALWAQALEQTRQTRMLADLRQELARVGHPAPRRIQHAPRTQACSGSQARAVTQRWHWLRSRATVQTQSWRGFAAHPRGENPAEALLRHDP